MVIMKPHQFFNLLEDRTSLPLLRDSVGFAYPVEFIEIYNRQIAIINKLKHEINDALDVMTELEQQHMHLVTALCIR